jgi:transcriptional regulator with XRE-family HTH domain
MKQHWTEGNVKDFLYSIASDFIEQLQQKMDELPMSQSELAAKLGVTEGRVSQILNKPSNLKLEKIIEYARALGMKVAIVAYDDGDSANKQGPVPAGIFNLCWEKARKPVNFRDVEKVAYAQPVFYYAKPNTIRHAETAWKDYEPKGTPNIFSETQIRLLEIDDWAQMEA